MGRGGFNVPSHVILGLFLCRYFRDVQNEVKLLQMDKDFSRPENLLEPHNSPCTIDLSSRKRFLKIQSSRSDGSLMVRTPVSSAGSVCL